MGLSTSTDMFVGKINRYATKLELNDRDVMRDAMKNTTGLLTAQVKIATGGDQLLSGLNRGGRQRRLTVSGRIEKRRNGYQAYIRARGPWQLVENDIAPHIVTPKKAIADRTMRGKTRRGRVGANSRRARQLTVARGIQLGGRAVMVWQGPGGKKFRRWTVAHSKGRQPWKKGVAAAKPVTTRMFVNRQRRTIREAFK